MSDVIIDTSTMSLPQPAALQAEAIERAVVTKTQAVASGANSWIANNLRELISALMPVADGAMIVAAATLSYAIRTNDVTQTQTYILEVIIAVLLSSIAFQYFGLYKIPNLNRLSAQMSRLLMIYAGVAGTLIILDYLLKVSDKISRVWSVTWFFTALALLVSARLVIWRAISSLYRAGKFATPVVLLGSRNAVHRLTAHMSPGLGKAVNIVGIFDADDDCAGAVAALAELSRDHCVDEVLIPLPWTNAVPLEAILRPLRNLPVVVRLIPDLPKTAYAALSLSEQCGLPAISVLERPLTAFQAAIKRAEDLIISSVALTVAAPVMLAIAVLIRLDGPGPVLFRQDRWGFNARRISVLKFRTMRIDTGDDPKVTQATRNDARVTRIGRILRRTSLDELPQLINVLRGDMSLVGPRPHAVAHNEHYVALIDNYLGRHRVKPGITGLAQINGCRGITDTIDKMQLRVTYDLRYIDSWSLILDFKVIFMTLFVGFTNRNAF